MVPVNAREVWSDPPLWTMGAWPDRSLRAVDGHGTRLAVFGSCSANDQELSRSLTAPDLAAACRPWGGSFIVVRLNSDGAVEVLTDAAGACPLYMVRTSDWVVWASSSLALSGLTGRRVDTEWLSSYLVDKQTPTPGRSAWADIVPVPAGHKLSLAAGEVAASTAWWTRTRRQYDDAISLVRRALIDGVGARIERATLSVDLAGMDSTTIAAIAATRGQVLGITVHPEGVVAGGDMDYARAFTHPGLTRALLPMQASHLPFSPSEDRLPPTDEPAPSATSWAMFSAQLRMAASAGSASHLTGDGGDNLFLPPPSHLADLVRRGRVVRAVRDAQRWARLRKISPWPVIGAAVRGDIRRLARPWMVRPAWVIDSAEQNAVPCPDADVMLVDDVRSAARPAHSDSQLADSLGIELHNPYFDGAVLDAVVSAPSWRRSSTRRYKPMLADAAGDLLPNAHRQRTAKGTFAADFHRGLRANLRRVVGLADGHLAAFGLIEPVSLRTAAKAAALGAETVWAALLPTLGAEMWLEAVMDAPVPTWTCRDGERIR